MTTRQEGKALKKKNFTISQQFDVVNRLHQNKLEIRSKAQALVRLKPKPSYPDRRDTELNVPNILARIARFIAKDMYCTR